MTLHRILFGLMLLSAMVSAQSIFFKPIAAYYLPRLTDVNMRIEDAIDDFRDNSGLPLPTAATFGNKVIFGGEIEYHLSEDYFGTIQLMFYNDDADTRFKSTSPTPIQFDYLRDISMVDVKVNFHQYFSYSSWRRFNKYFGIGVGIMQVSATSETVYIADNNSLINTTGEFSGTTLSASGYFGGEIRLAPAFKLWAEGGYLVGNPGRMDGKVRTLETSGNVDTTSESSFDLSGFFVRGGIGFAVPFLK
ncbi:MAG: hypothetical protein R3C41_06030 [Calditrichia bacterium]|nr:hypothetical protein [Calditrichota bacterium]MCB0268514.1 hypothetical protein [Calditrichota bacterium]MCB0288105.1 hypothetical protein [Calditrichota bacterium]MCB9070004.1 hypothetical protein [Calditrichia bacterium]